MADIDKNALEKLVRQVLLEKLGGTPAPERPAAHGVRSVAVPRLEVREADRLDTGRSGTGCGPGTSFPWRRPPGWAAASWSWKRPPSPGR